MSDVGKITHRCAMLKCYFDMWDSECLASCLVLQYICSCVQFFDVSIAVCFKPHGWITFTFCSKGNEFGTRTGERFKGCKCYLHGKQSDFVVCNYLSYFLIHSEIAIS